MNAPVIIDKPSTDLVVAGTLKAEVVFVPGGVDKIIAEIEGKVRAVKADVSTKSGRAEIASLAYKIARSKTALDGLGKDLVADWKKRAGVVDAERRAIRDRLDALHDEVRKPLDDFDAAEKTRVAAHESALVNIVAFTAFAKREPSAQEIAARLDELPSPRDRDWQEFAQRANEAIAHAHGVLTELLRAAERREAAAAEEQRRQTEQAAREQQEREGRIAALAAARAREEAEAKAAADAKAAAEAAAAEQRRVEQERLDALARAEKAEADRLAAEAQAAADAKAAAERAQAELARIERERERDRAAAIEAERKRVADKRAADAAATAKREADAKHKAAIDGEAANALRQWLTDDGAAAVVAAIASGSIPHVTISY